MKREDFPIHGFKVHTQGLLTEIADAALLRNAGILYYPLNIFRRYLISIAERSSELNDPILNKIMCDLTLYEIADLESKDFDQKQIDKIYKEYKEHKEHNQTKS